MSHTITFDAANKRVTAVVTRPVREEELISCFQEIRSNREFQTEQGILIDLSEAALPPTTSEANRLGKVAKTLFPEQRIAIVWPNVLTIRPWITFWVVASPDVYVRIFTSLSDAHAWLGTQYHHPFRRLPLTRSGAG